VVQRWFQVFEATRVASLAIEQSSLIKLKKKLQRMARHYEARLWVDAMKFWTKDDPLD
jgi:hypothetical protein